MAHDRGVRMSGQARRHIHGCKSCFTFRAQLKGVSQGLHSLIPSSPFGLLAKLGIGGSGAAAGSSVTGGGGVALLGGGGLFAAAAAKMTVVCCVAVLAGATVIHSHSTPLTHTTHPTLIQGSAKSLPATSTVGISPVLPQVIHNLRLRSHVHQVSTLAAATNLSAVVFANQTPAQIAALMTVGSQVSLTNSTQSHSGSNQTTTTTSNNQVTLPTPPKSALNNSGNTPSTTSNGVANSNSTPTDTASNVTAPSDSSTGNPSSTPATTNSSSDTPIATASNNSSTNTSPAASDPASNPSGASS